MRHDTGHVHQTTDEVWRTVEKIKISPISSFVTPEKVHLYEGADSDLYFQK